MTSAKSQSNNTHARRIHQSSLLMAIILLAYSLTPYVRAAETTLSLPIGGIDFKLEINFTLVLSLLIALLAAAGTDWIIKYHPKFVRRTQLPHLIVPAITAWVIGLPLINLPVNARWWVVFALGGLLLFMVITAEYMVYDISDTRRHFAAVGLTAVSYALFLFLAVAVRSTDMRLFLAAPTLAIAIFGFSLRTLYLNLEGRWVWHWAIAIALIIAQLALGLHYWPISPLKFGLTLLAPAYALITLAAGIVEGRPWRQILVEPLVMGILILAGAILI